MMIIIEDKDKIDMIDDINIINIIDNRSNSGGGLAYFLVM